MEVTGCKEATLEGTSVVVGKGSSVAWEDSGTEVVVRGTNEAKEELLIGSKDA